MATLVVGEKRGHCEGRQAVRSMDGQGTARVTHALGSERTVMAILGRAGVSMAARGANNIGKGVRQREKAVWNGRRQSLFPIGGTALMATHVMATRMTHVILPTYKGNNTTVYVY